MPFISLCPSSILLLHLLLLCHLYLPLLSCHNCLLNLVQHVSSFQLVRGTLQEGTGVTSCSVCECLVFDSR